MRHLDPDMKEIIAWTAAEPVKTDFTSDKGAFILKNNIPYNPLHDKGYVSIGCAPCTRAISMGEDVRSAVVGKNGLLVREGALFKGCSV